MSTLPSLLVTKHTVPPLRPSAVARPRLLARLNAGLAQPVVLVAAPAGFGKTTLLAAWASSQTDDLEPSSFTPAWVTLDSGDNDPARFLGYVLAALRDARPGLGSAAQSLLHSPQPAAPAVVVSALINDLAQAPYASGGRLALVLDDYHLIENEAIYAAVTLLIDQRPPGLCVVLASRAEPAGLPLARWRARGLLAELNADDMRFTPDEASTFLGQVMGLSLAPQAEAALAARTEGWVAGLQLAALAGAAAGGEAAGSNRFVAAYLLEEVFEGLALDRQQFLCEVAPLERLTGGLCAAVTGRDDSAALLEQLARDNLFVSRLDEQGQWYRLHQLFREFLQQQLLARGAGEAARINRLAAAWYAAQGLHAEAVACALAGGDLDEAARLAALAVPAMLQNGEFNTLGRWLDALPEEAVLEHPRLCVARVWLLLNADQPRQAEPYLARIAALLQAQPPAALRGELLALWAVYHAIVRQPERALELARQAEAHGPPSDAAVQPYIAFSLGAAHKMAFQAGPAEHSLRQAAALAEAAGNRYVACSALANLADIQYNLGQMVEAEQTNRRALALARDADGQPQPHAGWIYWAMARQYYEWDDLETAQDAAATAERLCALGGNYSMWARSLEVRAHVLAARRRVAEAEAVLDQAADKAAQSGDPRVAWAVTRHRVHLALAQGKLARARQWAAGLPAPDGDPYPFYFSLTSARLCLAEGQPAHALEHLARAEQALAQTSMGLLRIETWALQAVAHRACGQPERALAALERALAEAQPGRLVRTFVDEGAPMHELLRRAAGNGHKGGDDYVWHLLARFAQASAAAEPAVRLTGREREILRLMAAGLSNRQMADELVIAEATLKRHVSNLYLKLGAHSRTQALRRAAELRLL